MGKITTAKGATKSPTCPKDGERGVGEWMINWGGEKNLMGAGRSET